MQFSDTQQCAGILTTGADLISIVIDVLLVPCVLCLSCCSQPQKGVFVLRAVFLAVFLTLAPCMHMM